jgi:hypothetical protein
MSSSTSDTGPAQRPKLKVFQGREAPEPVIRGWASFMALPTSAQQGFMELLTVTVTESDEGAIHRAIQAFSEGQALDVEAVGAALAATQTLLRQAAALNLEGADFVQDLQELSGEDTRTPRIMASRYGPLKERVRETLLLQTLADHGKVLVDLDWRVDRVTSSDRLAGPEATVVLLSLTLQDAGGMERVSVQLTPQSVKLLQGFCNRFSGSN